MIGRPEPNSAPSMIRPCAALLFGSACAVTARSKRRASRPNRSPAPPIEAVSLRCSAAMPARLAAASKLAIAASAALSLAAHCTSMMSAGMPPITLGGTTGS